VEIEVRDGGEVILAATPIASLPDNNPYIDKQIYAWNQGGYVGHNANFMIQQYAGYWVKAKTEGVCLIFKPSVQINSRDIATAAAIIMETAGQWLSSLIPTPETAHADHESPPMPMSLDGSDKKSFDAEGSSCFIDAMMPHKKR
jgi:hypothetical protein